QKLDGSLARRLLAGLHRPRGEGGGPGVDRGTGGQGALGRILRRGGAEEDRPYCGEEGGRALTAARWRNPTGSPKRIVLDWPGRIRCADPPQTPTSARRNVSKAMSWAALTGRSIPAAGRLPRPEKPASTFVAPRLQTLADTPLAATPP